MEVPRTLTGLEIALMSLPARTASLRRSYYYGIVVAARCHPNIADCNTEIAFRLSLKKTVKLHKDVPVKQLWSLIVYDLETYSFIYSPIMRPGLSTFDMPNMKKNADGGVTLYFGPEAPEGLESNWIPTSGKKPFSRDGS